MIRKGRCRCRRLPYAPAPSSAAAMAQEAGKILAQEEDRKRSAYRTGMPGHAAIQFVPFAVESCGCMGWAALQRAKLNLGDVASASGRICMPKATFLRRAMQLVSVALKKGSADKYRRSELEYPVRSRAGLPGSTGRTGKPGLAPGQA